MANRKGKMDRDAKRNNPEPASAQQEPQGNDEIEEEDE